MSRLVFARARCGELRIHSRPPLSTEQVVQALERHRRHDARGRSACEKWGPGSSVSRVAIDGTGLVLAVKWVRPRGLRGALADLLRGSRPRRAVAGAARLERAGLRGPEVLAVAERRRRGLVRDSFLLTRFADDVAPLPALLPTLGRAERRHLAARLGDRIGCLHAAGLDQRDLKPSNILVSAGAEPLFLDLEALEARRRLSRARRARALAQLEVHACELLGEVSRSDRLRFLRAYLAHAPELAGSRRAFAAEVARRAAARRRAHPPVPLGGTRSYPLAPRAAPSQLRIALVHPRASRVGGVERQIHELARRLLDAGHEVHWFCRRIEAGVDPRLALHRVPDPARPVPWLRLWLFDALSRRAVRRAGAFDLVHGFGPTSRQDVYRDGSGCRVDFLAASGATRWSWLPKQRVALAIERRRYDPGSVRRVLAISERVAGQIRRHYALAPDQLEVVHPGVDPECFRPDAAARQQLRAELQLPDGAVAVAFVGSDWERKGLAPLLEALVDSPELWLLVLGRERRAAAWRARAGSLGLASRTRFLGWRTDPERVLAAADLFALPTRFDAFANAALEALATGLPVVISRRAGAAELVLEGKTGSVVDAGDPEALAAALRTWLDPGLRAAAAPLARETALRHAWDRHYERVLRVVQELATPAS